MSDPTTDDIVRLESDLARERERTTALTEALARAAYLAENLHGMIDRQVWRDHGADDQQGHYEGDYRQEQIGDEIRTLAALASSSAPGTADE